MRRALIGSVAIVGVLAAVLWWTWPAPAPETEPVVAQEVPRAKAKHRPPRKVERPVHRADPPVRVKRVDKEPVLEPAAKATARSEFREERLSEVDAQLDAYAEKKGWDPEFTEEVRSLLVDTMDHIGEQLARVDRGELPWEEVRSELRQFRLDRASELEELLGNDFDEFAQQMSFGRFLGEPPPGRARFERAAQR
jgi:hypothetical protein